LVQKTGYYFRAISAALGLNSTRLDGISLQALTEPEQQDIFSLSVETTVVFAAVEVWVVLAEQQGLSSLADF
jgi:hypothetical protein